MPVHINIVWYSNKYAVNARNPNAKSYSRMRVHFMDGEYMLVTDRFEFRAWMVRNSNMLFRD